LKLIFPIPHFRSPFAKNFPSICYRAKFLYKVSILWHKFCFPYLERHSKNDDFRVLGGFSLNVFAKCDFDLQNDDKEFSHREHREYGEKQSKNLKHFLLSFSRQTLYPLWLKDSVLK